MRYWEEHLPSAPPERTWVAERGGRVIGLTHLGPSRDPDAPGPPSCTACTWSPRRWAPAPAGRSWRPPWSGSAAGPWDEAILWTLPGDHRAARFYRAWGWEPDGGAKTGHTPLGDLDEVRYRTRLRS